MNVSLNGRVLRFVPGRRWPMMVDDADGHIVLLWDGRSWVDVEITERDGLVAGMRCAER